MVDWNGACIGNTAFDLAFWLPSLALELGRWPSELGNLPEVREFAAYLAGFFAARAGLPAPATAPQVREFQQSQLRTSLQWAIETLDLAAADGPLAAI